MLQFSTSLDVSNNELEILLDDDGLDALQVAIETARKEGHDHLYSIQWNGRGDLTTSPTGNCYPVVTIKFVKEPESEAVAGA